MSCIYVIYQIKIFFHIVHLQFLFYALSHQKMNHLKCTLFFLIFITKTLGSSQQMERIGSSLFYCHLKESENKGDIKRCLGPSHQNLLAFHILKDWILCKVARPFFVPCRKSYSQQSDKVNITKQGSMQQLLPFIQVSNENTGFSKSQ